MDETLKLKFTALIEYQKKDIELRKLNSVIERDEALAAMDKNRRVFNEAKQAIDECDGSAGSILDQYASLQKYIEENEALLDELEKAESLSEADLEARVKKLESLKSKFQTADKKIHDIDEKSSGVCKRRADALKYGNAAKMRYNEAKDKHNALIESKKAELDKLKSELDRLKSELDPKLLEEYQSLVNENKFPPVVPAAGDVKKAMFNCGGCGLSLPQKSNAQLVDRGWCRCENCRRVIVHF